VATNDAAKYIDANDGEPWSEMDLWDLKDSLARGLSIEEVAAFLCCSGTVDEVRRRRVGPGMPQPARRALTHNPRLRRLSLA
jgi:hypothetical protein